jgi:hypothetical protein
MLRRFADDVDLARAHPGPVLAMDSECVCDFIKVLLLRRHSVDDRVGLVGWQRFHGRLLFKVWRALLARAIPGEQLAPVKSVSEIHCDLNNSFESARSAQWFRGELRVQRSHDFVITPLQRCSILAY